MPITDSNITNPFTDTVGDRNTRIAKFDEALTSLSAPCRNLVRAVVTRDDTETFFDCPASLEHHHCYIGGLAEHTLEVVDNVKYMLESQGMGKELAQHEKDLVLTAAFLHDVGKAICYQILHKDGRTIGVTSNDMRVLVGHIVAGYGVVADEIRHPNKQQTYHFEKNDVYDEEWVVMLLHLILSHHGRLEWGSPVAPTDVLSQILHQADVLSSQTHIYARSIVRSRLKKESEQKKDKEG